MKSDMFDSVLFEEHLRTKKVLKDSSIYIYVRVIEKFLTTDPNLNDLEDYNKFLVEGTRRRRCSHYYSVIKSFIEWKISDNSLKEKLIKGLVMPKRRGNILKKRVYLDENKIFDVINFLEKEKHRIIAIIQTLTGVRAGDVLRIKDGDIMLDEYNDKPILKLNIVGKGDKDNVVPIIDEIAQELIFDYILNHKSTNGYYFLELGKMRNREGQVDNEFMMVKMNYLWYWMDLKQALQAAGIRKEDFATHDFRRCFARRHWEKYKDVNKLRKILRHTDSNTTLRYLEHSGQDIIDMHAEMQK